MLLALSVARAWGGVPLTGEPRIEIAPSPDDRVTFNFQDLELHKVVELLTLEKNLNVIAPPGLDQKVTANLSGIPWEQALRLILKQHGLGFEREGDVIRIDSLQSLEQSPEVEQYRVLHLDRERLEDALGAVLSDQESFRVLPLPRRDGGALFAVLVTAFADTHRRIGTLLGELDRRPRGQESRIQGPHPDGTLSIHVHGAPVEKTVKEIGDALGVNVVWMTAPAGSVSADLERLSPEATLELLLAPLAYQFELSDRLLRIGHQDSFKKTVKTRVLHLEYANPNDLVALIRPLLTPPPVGSVVVYGAGSASGTGKKQAEGPQPVAQAFQATRSTQGEARQPPSNMLAVTDTIDVLARIQDVIREADRPPQQVAIAVKLVEVTFDKDWTLGIRWDISVDASGASAQNMRFPFERADFRRTGVEDTFTLGTLTAANLTLMLRALSERNLLKVLSSPTITTLTHQPANILIGQRFPITVETIERQTLLRTITLDHYEDIGIQLAVTPRVVGEDRINLVVRPRVSSVGTLVDNRFPIINTREADTQLVIRSGDTAVIGGLLTDQTNRSEQGLPGLAHIPIIGRFFGGHRKTKNKSELLIFVTPRIIKSGDDVEIVKYEEYRGVQQLARSQGSIDRIDESDHVGEDPPGMGDPHPGPLYMPGLARSMSDPSRARMELDTRSVTGSSGRASHGEDPGPVPGGEAIRTSRPAGRADRNQRRLPPGSRTR